MPHFEYDKDYPFAAFITNLGKYNEGELVGEWVKFPTTADELKKVFERIGIGSEDDFGNPYEEWFITDYDCYVGGLYDKLGEYANLDELNYLAAKLDDMDRSEYNQFLAAMEMGEHTGSIQDIINLTENLDCYDVYPDIEDHDDLGRYYIDELDAMQVPDHLRNYIDYEAYGRDVALEEGGEFTEFGYVRDTGDTFYEVYDGDRENIPEEYRVMNFRDEDMELSESDKLDMATDLAFDLDEFFRQHDPQYAAQHPEPHEQKEVIADLLLEGKTAALRQQLQEMAQTEDDVLPGRIAEYEREAGYDPKQDTSIEEDRALLVQRPEQPDDHLTGDRVQTPRGSFSIAFSIAMTGAYGVLQYSPTVTNVLVDGGSTQTISQAMFFGLMLGIIVFLVYADSIFLKYKSREIGIFLSLGIDRRSVQRIVVKEYTLLFQIAALLGLILSVPLAYLCWTLLNLFLETQETAFSIGYAGLGLVLKIAEYCIISTKWR